MEPSRLKAEQCRSTTSNPLALRGLGNDAAEANTGKSIASYEPRSTIGTRKTRDQMSPASKAAPKAPII